MKESVLYREETLSRIRRLLDKFLLYESSSGHQVDGVPLALR